jgi:hypothetical protein
MDYDFASDLKVVNAITPAVVSTDQTSVALNTALYPNRKGAPMMFVRVLESGMWRTAPIGPDAEYEKTLVMSRVVGLWNVNRKPVDVWPGLILSFMEADDAQFFKSSDVGSMPMVETARSSRSSATTTPTTT